MRIIIIHTGIAIDVIGVRLLSSILKREGHQTELLFLPNMEYELLRRGFHKGTITPKYSERALENIISFCKGADLIGLSLISRDLDASIQITSKLKQAIKAPILWGGFHPTVCPEECLEYADIVCIGEAEESIVKLTRSMDAGKDYSGLPGLWSRHGLNRSLPGRLIMDLDSIPFPDYDCSTHHLLLENEIVPVTKELLGRYMTATFPSFPRILPRMQKCLKPGMTDYHIIATRGCPYDCTFCGSPQLKQIYSEHKFIRRRSVDNIIAELRSIKDNYEFVTDVHFCDDCFMLASDEYIEEFSDKYKREIDMPFYVLTSPATITENKLRCLVTAGLSFLSVGIQTGSKKTLEMYKRTSANKGIENKLDLINNFKDHLYPYYDFLIDNPYESDDDLLDTLELIKRIKRPYKIRIYSLVPLPGTELNRKQKNDNLLEDDSKKYYRKDFAERSKEKRYLNLLIDLSRYQLPSWVLRFLTSGVMVRLFTGSALKYCVKIVYDLISFKQYISEKRRLTEGDLLRKITGN